MCGRIKNKELRGARLPCDGMLLVFGVQSSADRSPGQTCLLGDLTHDRTLGRLTRPDSAGRDLDASLRSAHLIENEQLTAMPQTANYVGRDALSTVHTCSLRGAAGDERQHWPAAGDVRFDRCMLEQGEEPACRGVRGEHRGQDGERHARHAHGHRSGDWFDEVAEAEHRGLFRDTLAHLGLRATAAAPCELPQPERKQIARLLSGREWPEDLQAGYRELTAAVSDASARRWRGSMDRSGSSESMLWRLLRIGSAPYFVLGANRTDRLHLRVGTPWDWRQAFHFRRLDVRAGTGGQPRVDWSALYTDRQTGEDHTVDGHVEVRWSHGRFSGPPEAKVYLDTPHHAVPGYFQLR